MSAGEPIIHLKNPRDTHVNLWVPQDHLDGLNQLLHFVEALQKHGGQGHVPGSFELVMHYRMIRQAVQRAEEAQGTEQELSPGDLIAKCSMHPAPETKGLRCSICDKSISHQWCSVQLEPTNDRIVWCGGINCMETVAALWNERDENGPVRTDD